MKRVRVAPRANADDRARASGVLDVVRSVQSPSGVEETYRTWDENTMYVFTKDEVNGIMDQVSPIVQMSRDAVDFILDGGWGTLGLRRDVFSFIRDTFDNRRRELFSRYDFAYESDGSLSLVGIQGDSPSLIVETARTQRDWLLERFPKQVKDGSMTQLNVMPEMIASVFNDVGETVGRNLHILDSGNDWILSSYISSLALETGLAPHTSKMRDVRWNEKNSRWEDEAGASISTFYKNQTWDMILPSPALAQSFIKHSERFDLSLEPSWKMMLSSRAVIPALHYIFPNSPIIPESSFEDSFGFGDDSVCAPVHPFVSRNEMASLKGRGFTSWGEPLKDFSSQKSLVYRRLHIPRRYRDATYGGYRFPFLSFYTVGGHLAGVGVQESKLPLLGAHTTFKPHVVMV